MTSPPVPASRTADLAPAAALQERALLHQGGTPGTWGSLGLWLNDDQPAPDYAAACMALARTVGRAAGMKHGDRVLSVACGAGDELHLWRSDFQVKKTVGVEINTALVAAAQRGASERVEVRYGSATGLVNLKFAPWSFDRVVCVDAAYHFKPRTAFISSAFGLLKPGGRLVYTDITLAPQAPAWKKALLRTGARACGLPGGALQSVAAHEQLLLHTGFVDVQVQVLDDAVLGGFARFVRAQGPRLGRDAFGSAWRRPAVTAGLIGPGLGAGLGYALFSATRPRSASGSASAQAARSLA